MTRTVRHWHLTPWLFALLAVGGLVTVVKHFAEFQQFVEMARKAKPVWLLVGFVLQVATYFGVAWSWRIVLDSAGQPQPLRKLVNVALSKLFADQALPGAGISGNVLLIERLTALGTARGKAMAALLISMIGYYAAYAALALVMLFTLWLHDKASPLLVGIVTMFLTVAIAIPSLALWLRHRGSQPLPPQFDNVGPVRRLLSIVGEAPAELVRNRRLISQVTALNGLVFLVDAATLAACLCALGQPFLPSTAFIALMSASIAMTLLPIPLGLGSFEASCVGMLTLLGVRIEPAVTATLLLRGMILWLPLVLGLVMIRSGHRRSS
jgi:uncharacterized membrane protein YbhN (UPF0104 family)